MKLISFTALGSTGYYTVLVNADKIVGLAAVRDDRTYVPTGEAGLILDGGIALELDDSFEEAKAKLKAYGCAVDERIAANVQYEPYR